MAEFSLFFLYPRRKNNTVHMKWKGVEKAEPRKSKHPKKAYIIAVIKKGGWMQELKKLRLQKVTINFIHNVTSCLPIFFNSIVFNGSATRSDFHVKQKIEKCTPGGIFMYAMYAIPGQTCQIYSQKLTFYPKSFPKKKQKRIQEPYLHTLDRKSKSNLVPQPQQ